MTIKNKILDDMKLAMKDGESLKKSTLRMLLSEISYAQTASDAKIEMDERAQLKVLSTYKKRLEKSLKDYPDGDQKDKIQKEIEIVNQYLPKEIDESELDKIIDQTIKNNSEKNFGVIMKIVLAEVGPSANGRIISEKIKNKLKN